MLFSVFFWTRSGLPSRMREGGCPPAAAATGLQGAPSAACCDGYAAAEPAPAGRGVSVRGQRLHEARSVEVPLTPFPEGTRGLGVESLAVVKRTGEGALTRSQGP